MISKAKPLLSFRILVLALCFTLVPALASAQGANRSITNIAGDVYRFQNNFHYSIFTITGDGVVVADPINRDAAIWLKGEIEKLTDQKITHLVYSHSHGDHASGGRVFGEASEVIVQENAPDSIDGVTPTKRFSDTLTFSQGNKTFELTYLGPGHGIDLAVMIVRPENVAFVVDVVASKRLFYRDFPNSDVGKWADQIKKIESLDFEILAGGHGPVGVKSDVTDARIYLEELREEVLAGLKAGQSVDELKSSIKMEKYKDWASYDDWLALNIQGMARHLTQSGAVN